MVQDYYGTCEQNYVFLTGCRTDSDECKNGASMQDFGGIAQCCCRCCRNGWCSHNVEDDDDCRGSATFESSLQRRALMNVTRGEERMNKITNIDENTDDDFEMDQMHNAPNNEE